MAGWDIDRLYAILKETTAQFRKGEVVHGTPELVEAIKAGKENLPGGVATIDAMPHFDSAPADLLPVDCYFLVVGVSPERAQTHKAELIDILNHYPQPGRLAKGPSYIEVGGEIGDQGAAFRLFALGKVLGLWGVITPALLGLDGELADRAAGSGFIMITGYHPS